MDEDEEQWFNEDEVSTQLYFSVQILHNNIIFCFQDEWEDEQPGSITGLTSPGSSGIKSATLTSSLVPRVNSTSRETASTSQASGMPYQTPPRPKSANAVQWEEENRNGAKLKGKHSILICYVR